ncbi:MAG TPA: DoxX family protein [Bacteroidales bacterium]|nr:DoxX family protein [Bacteroidales bacterium]
MLRGIFSIKLNEGLLNLWLLVFRLGVSAMMLTHGLPKLSRLLPGQEISFPDPLGIGMWLSLFLAVFAEVICSLLIILGLATRLAAVPLVITMAVAAFMVHASDPFVRKELALMYLLAYITLLIAGPGKFSVDRYLKI